jgi:glycosyltransferase involved in cell wall biosynthesis
MIAHHFPPAGGSGSNRALAFARYLPIHGWRPTVVTPGDEWAANLDAELLREVPGYLRVVRTGSLEALPRQIRDPLPLGEGQGEGSVSAEALPSPPASPSGRGSVWRSHLGHLRRFPDAHLGWLPFALAAARRQPFDVAYSSSGPFTAHVVGLLLKRLERKPWVAELRDGWYRWNRAIFPDYPPWRDWLERRLEAAAIRSADRVVLVTERMAVAFRNQFWDLPADHFAVVSNGFDPSQFDTPAPADGGDGWQVVHAGALYYGRSLAAFLDAVRCLMNHNADFERDFHLQLIGTLDDGARREIARGGLGARVQVHGQTSHAAAIEAMRAADVLLLVANTTPGAQATVPGKLFEYLAVGRPVVAIAPAESSTADVLRHTGGGWIADAGDVGAIAATLGRAYAERGRRPQNTAALATFDRRRLAGDLASILDGVLAGAARRI